MSICSKRTAASPPCCKRRRNMVKYKKKQIGGKVMVVLIAGCSHTGKTLLAQKLLQQYYMPCLSMDHLKMGLIRSGQTSLTPEDDEALTAYLWPIVREMVKTAVENRQDLIVEGCYIPFDWASGITSAYLADIRYCCLIMSEAYIDAHYTDMNAHS